MKLGVLLVLSLVLGACSKSNNSQEGSVKSYKLLAEGNGSFGVVPYGDVKTKTIVLTNDQSSATSVNPQLSSNSPFQIGAVLGCQNIEPQRSCVVKLLFNSNGKSAGEYHDNLVAGDQTISLSAQIESVPSPAYKVSINNQVIGAEGLDLGILKTKEIQLKTIKIKNHSPMKGQISSLQVTNPFFQIIHSTCNQIAINPGGSCFAKLLVKGTSVSEIKNSEIVFDNYTGSITLENQHQDYNSQFVAGNSEIEMGDFYESGEQILKAITFKNEGLGAGDLNLISLPPEYSIVTNNCQGVKPGNKCAIRLLYKNADKNKGQYNSIINYGDGEVETTINQVNRLNELSQIIISAPAYVHKSNCQEIQVSLKDHENISYISSQDTVLSSGQIFADTNCSQSLSNLVVPSFASSQKAYIKYLSQENVVLSFSKDSLSASQNIVFYDTLTVAASSEMLTTQSYQVSASGGVLPYSYELISGLGSVSTSGLFSPGNIQGSSSVKIRDALNQEAVISISQFEPLAVSNSFDLGINQSYNLIPSKGKLPYSYEKVSGLGSVNSSGSFTAGSSAGYVQLKVKDALNQEVMVTGTVFGLVQISPNSNVNPLVNQGINFSANTGKPPYVFSMVSGLGTISSSGSFTAGVSAGAVQIKVEDALNQQNTFSFTVHPEISINTSNCANIPETQSCTISATGGFGSRTFAVDKGVINASSGLYTGSCVSNSGQTVITVTDSLGNQKQATVFTPCIFNSCLAVKNSGYGLSSNVYWLDPDGPGQGLPAYEILCDMETDGGGWEVIQQRVASTDFYKTWAEYRAGFGTVALAGNYWIGNDRIAQLVPPSSSKEVYFKMKWNNQNYFQRFPRFSIDSVNNQFKMNVLNYNNSGTAGDSFSALNGQRFSTKDSDNDVYSGLSCAQTYQGAWWYSNCHDSNLNGIYGSTAYAMGLNWTSLTTYYSSVSQVAIMIREQQYIQYPKNCYEAKIQGVLNQAGNQGNGIYTIDPDGKNTGLNPITVTCDMVNGGWTLINNQIGYSNNTSSCTQGSIDANGVWSLSANLAGGGSNTHGGCGISTRVPIEFQSIKFTDSSFTSNATCGNVPFPNAHLYIVDDVDGPIADYNGSEYYYPGQNYYSRDGAYNSAGIYTQSAHGLANQTYTVSQRKAYNIHLGVGSFTGCVNRSVSTKIWVK